MSSGLIRKVSAQSPLMAEAIARTDAVILADNLNFQKVIFESDCKALIFSCSGKSNRWLIEPVVEDILTISRRLSNANFNWIPGDCNKVAHWLASACLHEKLSPNWVTINPPQLQVLLSNDMQAV